MKNTFSFNNKSYSVNLLTEDVKKEAYGIDTTVFVTDPLLDISQLSLPVSEQQKILLVAPSFLSTLCYAAALRKQYPSSSLNLIVMDLNPFVIDCWDTLKKLVSAYKNSGAPLDNNAFAARFSTFLQKKINEGIFGLNLQEIQLRDPNKVMLADGSNFKSQISDPLLNVLNAYSIELLSEIVSNVTFFCGSCTDDINARTLSRLLADNPALFSVFYASNVIEVMYFSAFTCALLEQPKDRNAMMNSFMDEQLGNLLRPKYHLSIHLYTRRNLALTMEKQCRFDETKPNKILVVPRDRGCEQSMRRNLSAQLDTVFLQSFYPSCPSLDNIVGRQKEWAPICVWSENGPITLAPAPSAPSITQNRHASFPAQSAQSGKKKDDEQANDDVAPSAGSAS